MFLGKAINIIFKKKKNPLKETQILQDIVITLELISSLNKKPKYHLSKNPPIIKIRPIIIIIT